MNSARLAALVLTLAVAGCATTAATRQDDPTPPPLRNPAYYRTEASNLIAGCDGGNRVYVISGSDRLQVVANDPQCAAGAR